MDDIAEQMSDLGTLHMSGEDNMEFKHKSVLISESIEALQIKTGRYIRGRHVRWRRAFL